MKKHKDYFQDGWILLYALSAVMALGGIALIAVVIATLIKFLL